MDEHGLGGRWLTPSTAHDSRASPRGGNGGHRLPPGRGSSDAGSKKPPRSVQPRVQSPGLPWLPCSHRSSPRSSRPTASWPADRRCCRRGAWPGAGPRTTSPCRSSGCTSPGMPCGWCTASPAAACRWSSSTSPACCRGHARWRWRSASGSLREQGPRCCIGATDRAPVHQLAQGQRIRIGGVPTGGQVRLVLIHSVPGLRTPSRCLRTKAILA